MKQMQANWARLVTVGVLAGFGLSAQGSPVPGQGTWETTLQGRDLDGNLSTFEAYYDTALNVTWLADARYAKTSGYDSDGLMSWAAATAWAEGLNPYNSGITHWRLPKVIDTGTPGCNWSYSGTDCGYNVDTASGEMSHMFYVTLGDKAPYNTSGAGPQPGYGLSNTGPFSNIQSGVYWSATEYAPDTNVAWGFSFADGSPDMDEKTTGHDAWAVHNGDVGAAVVPVPAAVWLMSSGLAVLGVARRRNSAT